MAGTAAGDAEGARLDGRDEVEQVLERDVGGGEAEVVQHLEDVPPRSVAVLVQLLHECTLTIIIIIMIIITIIMIIIPTCWPSAVSNSSNFSRSVSSVVKWTSSSKKWRRGMAWMSK